MQAAPPPQIQQHVASHTIVIQQTAQVGPRVYGGYRHQQARFLGWSQIAIGLVSIICWSMAIYFDSMNDTHFISTIFSVVGAGIWCGLFFLLPGAFGVASAGRKTMCPIVTFMVLSIVSLVLFDLYYIGWSGAALGISLNMPRDECAPYSVFFANDPDDCKKNDALIAMYAICVAMSLLYVIISIWSSVICCMAVCCGSTTPATGTEVHYVNAEGQVLLAQGGNQPQGVVQQNPQQQYPQQQHPQQQYPQQQYPQQQYPQQQYPQQQYLQQQYPIQQYPQQQNPQQQTPLQQQYPSQQYQQTVAYHGQVPSAPDYAGHSSSELPPPYGEALPQKKQM